MKQKPIAWYRLMYITYVLLYGILIPPFVYIYIFIYGGTITEIDSLRIFFSLILFTVFFIIMEESNYEDKIINSRSNYHNNLTRWNNRFDINKK